MIYEKPEVEIIAVEDEDIITASGNYSSSQDAVYAACGGYTGAPLNNFTCDNFGGYTRDNPPKNNATVYLNGGEYVFNAVGYGGHGNGQGGHWKCSKNN